MKKLIYPFLCCCFCFSLLSCDTGTTPSEKTTPAETSTDPASTTKTEETPAPVTTDNTPPAATEPEAGAGKEITFPIKTTGECIYIEYKGEAKINGITDAEAGADNCPNAQMVEFSFGPINRSDIRKYKYTLFKDDSQFLTLHGGLNPSKEWVTRNGITEGTILQCIRKELFQGSCTKVVFEFTEVDTNPKERCK